MELLLILLLNLTLPSTDPNHGTTPPDQGLTGLVIENDIIT